MQILETDRLILRRLLPEENGLPVTRRVVPKVVEAGFPDRHGLRVRQKLGEGGHLLVAGRARVMRVIAEQTGCRIALPDAARELRASCNFHYVFAREALDELLLPRGFDWRIVSDTEIEVFRATVK